MFMKPSPLKSAKTISPQEIHWTQPASLQLQNPMPPGTSAQEPKHQLLYICNRKSNHKCSSNDLKIYIWEPTVILLAYIFPKLFLAYAPPSLPAYIKRDPECLSETCKDITKDTLHQEQLMVPPLTNNIIHHD